MTPPVEDVLLSCQTQNHIVMKKYMKRFAILFEESMKATLKIGSMPSMYTRHWYGYFAY